MTMSRAAHWGFIFLVLIALSMPMLTLAQGQPGGAVFDKPIVPTECNGIGGCQNVCTLATLAQNLVNAAIFIAVFMSATLFAVAGIKMLSAGGGNQVGEAKKIFTNVVIGLLLVLAAWLLVDTIFAVLTGNHLWSKMC